MIVERARGWGGRGVMPAHPQKVVDTDTPEYEGTGGEGRGGRGGVMRYTSCELGTSRLANEIASPE